MLTQHGRTFHEEGKFFYAPYPIKYSHTGLQIFTFGCNSESPTPAFAIRLTDDMYSEISPKAYCRCYVYYGTTKVETAGSYNFYCLSYGFGAID